MTTPTPTPTAPADPAVAALEAERERLRARLAELDEVIPTREAGRYEGWPELPTELDDQVRQALAALEVVVRRVERLRSAQGRLRLTTTLDRALADPECGFALRLRALRSGALRELVASGRTVPALAKELNLSRHRVWTIVHNNRTYCSSEREEVLEELAAERAARAAARRATARADRTADLAAKAEARRLERVAAGRPLLARLAAGATREALQDELGWSRQRLALVLADTARAVEAEPIDGGVAVGAHDENETTAPLAA